MNHISATMEFSRQSWTWSWADQQGSNTITIIIYLVMVLYRLSKTCYLEFVFVLPHLHFFAIVFTLFAVLLYLYSSPFCYYFHTCIVLLHTYQLYNQVLHHMSSHAFLQVYQCNRRSTPNSNSEQQNRILSLLTSNFMISSLPTDEITLDLTVNRKEQFLQCQATVDFWSNLHSFTSQWAIWLSFRIKSVHYFLIIQE